VDNLIPNEYLIQMDPKDIQLCKFLIQEHDIQFISYNKSTILNNDIVYSVILFDLCILSIHYEKKICFINFNISIPPNLACMLTMTLMISCCDYCSYVKAGENFIYDSDGKAVFGSEAEAYYTKILAEKFEPVIKRDIIFDRMLYSDLDHNGLEH